MMRIRIFFQFLAVPIFVFSVFYLLWMETIRWKSKFKQIEKQMEIQQNPSDFCDGENMAYNLTFLGSTNIRPYFLRAIKFDCTLLGHLLRFKLTDKFHRISGQIPKINDPRLSNEIIFVFAANYVFYPSLRAMIANVRTNFDSNIPIIVYDLGELATQKNSQNELMAICNLELRPFNFSILPQNLRKLKIFAWKVVIFAEMLSQFNSFIYFDTSIQFITNNYAPFFKGINDGMLSDIQFPLGTHHGLKFATDPGGMFKYIPIDPILVQNWANSDDIEMMEANMIIVRKTEFTRQIFKWSLLCALTKDCINPEGSQISCQHYDADQLAEDGQCHRQDQSVLNILLHNAEFQLINSGSKITPHLRYNHPRNWEGRHILKRGQSTLENIVAKYGCGQ